jgi:glutaredoxin-dependent peroxiredoxin
MKIETRQQAPGFSLYSSEKTKVSLEDFKGSKVVLIFFPLAFTSVCTQELCMIRDGIAEYNNASATVLGISVDSVYTLAKFREEQHLNFSLLSDFNKEVSASYGALYETFGFDMKGVSKRAAFVIDKHGIIRYSEVLENAKEIPDFNAIKTALEDIV